MPDDIRPGAAAPANLVWEFEFVSPLTIGVDRAKGHWPRSEWRDQPAGAGSTRPLLADLESRIPARTLRGAANWWWDMLGRHSKAFQAVFGAREPGPLPQGLVIADGVRTRWDDDARVRTWSFNRFDRAARRPKAVHRIEAAGLGARYQAPVAVGADVSDAARRGIVFALLAVRAIGADRTSGFGRCHSRLFAGSPSAPVLRPARAARWVWETDYAGQAPAELYCVHHLLRHPDPAEALALVRRHVGHKRTVEGAALAQALWGREDAATRAAVTVSALRGSPLEFRARSFGEVVLDWSRVDEREQLDPSIRGAEAARGALLELVVHLKGNPGRRPDGR